MPVKETTVKKQTVKKAVVSKPKATGLSVPVYSLAGKESGNLELPKEIFGAKVNQQLLAQALRVYLSNQKGHFSSTKTRGEVAGSTRKIFKQKGTGHARHGSIKAPIFVGGGIALGPKFRKVVLTLPKKMKQKALTSALSVKFQSQEIIGLEGLEKASGKTSQIQSLLNTLGKKDVLILADKKEDKAFRAVRNLPTAEILAADQVSLLDIIKHQTLVLTQEAVGKLQSRLKQNKESN